MQTLVPLSWSSFCFFRDIYSFFLFCFVLFLWVWICQEKRFMYIVTSNNTWYSKWYRLIFWAWNRHCILRNLPLFFFLCFYVKSSRFQCCYVSVKKKKKLHQDFACICTPVTSFCIIQSFFKGDVMQFPTELKHAYFLFVFIFSKTSSIAPQRALYNAPYCINYQGHTALYKVTLAMCWFAMTSTIASRIP